MNNTNNATEISEQVLTRVCHDVIGNIGAVANAVELLEEGDLDFLEDIKSILKTSSSVLSARLKFFRLAFGLSNANLSDAMLVAKTAREYLMTIGNKNFPIELDMPLLSEKFARSALLAIMIAADTMIKGGVIKLEEQNNQLYIMAKGNVPASAEKLKSLRECIELECEPQAQFAAVAFLKEILKDLGYGLHMSESNNLELIIK